MKICCVFPLESPHRGDSNEYTQHTIINIKKKNTLNYPKYYNVCIDGIFSNGLKVEFEINMVTYYYQYKKEKHPKLSQIL